jgi:hypothetical protein
MQNMVGHLEPSRDVGAAQTNWTSEGRIQGVFHVPASGRRPRPSSRRVQGAQILRVPMLPILMFNQVWEIYLDGESKKTQLYADAHVKVLEAAAHVPLLPFV